LYESVVLLVDDDQADVLERRKDGRARADDDVDVAAADSLPLVVRSPSERPLCWMATRSPKATRNRVAAAGRQRDLRHEHQHAASGRAHRRRQADVDLGLAAAGHAVEQGGPELAGGGEREEAVERGGLLPGQLAGRPGGNLIGICGRPDANLIGTCLRPDRDLIGL
jgi:hypothetical protein